MGDRTGSATTRWIVRLVFALVVLSVPPFAADLVRLRVNVIVTIGTPATRAAKNATETIPIVFARVGDPVGSGFVRSLARPGGNLTGVSILTVELGAKRLELLREAVPGVTRVGPSWPILPSDRRIGRSAPSLKRDAVCPSG